MQEYTAGQSVLIVGVPGAFTPTASDVQIPTFFEHQDALKELGIDNVIVYTVNDSAVVGIWNKQLVEAYGKPNSLVTFFGDPSGAFTQACGMQLEQTPELTTKGLYGRCKRFAMYVVDNVVEEVVISETPYDATGDINPEATCAESMIRHIKAIQGIDS
jgi:peroxiredoxin